MGKTGGRGLRIGLALPLAALAVLLALVAAMAVNTWRSSSRQSAPTADVADGEPVAVDLPAAARRLGAAVRLPTVSAPDGGARDEAAFDRLHALLAAEFPRVHATLTREVVGRKALLYTWAGSDVSARPVALMAHQDVVPIAPGTESAWTVPPFGGEVRDGFVWGRGTLDDKGNLLAQLEAVESLLGAGFRPRRTVHLIFGDDEEVGGLQGAKAVARLLAARGVRLDWVLDEGLLVLDGALPGLAKPAALIGVAEKGYGTFFLTLDVPPGHSSMPPAQSAIGQMSAALTRLETQPMAGTIRGVARDMFATLAPDMEGLNRYLLTNLWLTAPVVAMQLAKSPSSNAMLRTTTALTVVRAGDKDNVLPGHAEATVNFRILPGDTLASVESHLRRRVANDAIRIAPSPGNAEPSPVSPTDGGPGYAAIARAVRATYPDAVVAPGLMTAATDSRHLGGASDAVYRFSPMRLTLADLPRLHGTDERLSLDNLARMIRFYQRLLRDTDAAATVAGR
ncbi:MAG: M20 family peptidase [Variovorax sp.]|nr:MAG: M20 family peptidase [Variovorax sp.]